MWNPFSRSQVPLPIRTLDEIKGITNILFIDDRKFDVVDILIRDGWMNTRRVKDIESITQKEVQEAHIIFVDIEGVGKKLGFKEEGLGLIPALKDRYPTKKLIVYSANDIGDRFHVALSAADSRLSKNSDPIQFQEIVERFSKEAFSLEECIGRITKILSKELGRSVESDEVAKKLQKVYSAKRFDNDFIEKVFKLQNIENAAKLTKTLASIIILFIKQE